MTRSWRLSLTILSFALAATPALAQDADGSKDHPDLPRLPAYVIGAYQATDVGTYRFPLTDDRQEAVEGKHWRIRYDLKAGARRASPVEILRHYQNAFRAKGGDRLFADERRETLRLKTAAGELWCQVEVRDAGGVYELDIIEKGALGQQMGSDQWTGRISAGMMAIGGETTGFSMTVGQDRFELQPADEAMRRQLRALDGKVATVRGTLETREGVEVRTRRIIRVTEVREN